MNLMDSHPFLMDYHKPKGLDESRKLDLSYYITDFWNDVADPDINGKPFMSGGPWGFLALLSFLIYWIRIQGPNCMKGKEAKDLRAILLIFNGFTFGAYLTGGLTGLFWSDMGLSSFNCSALDPHDRSLNMYIRKTAGYMFLFGKMWDFIRPVLAVYRKKDAHITKMYLFHCFFIVTFTYLGLKFHPGGIFTFLPYLDGIHHILAYAYLIKASASPMFKPSDSFRIFLYRARMTSAAFALLHGLYFLTIPNCGPTFMKLLQVAYGVVCLLVGPGDFREMEEIRESYKDQQKSE